MSFLKGQFDVGLVLPVLIGLLYAGTGGWTAERWNTALAVMGLSVAKRSWNDGYDTYNPNLRLPPQGIEKPRDEHGRFVSPDR